MDICIWMFVIRSRKVHLMGLYETLQLPRKAVRIVEVLGVL